MGEQFYPRHGRALVRIFAQSDAQADARVTTLRHLTPARGSHTQQHQFRADEQHGEEDQRCVGHQRRHRFTMTGQH